MSDAQGWDIKNEIDRELKLSEFREEMQKEIEKITELERRMQMQLDELKKVMLTPQKPDENLDAIVTPALTQFDLLFDQLESHKLLMQRKGKL